MESFLEWINNNVTVSSHPTTNSAKKDWWNGYDLIINVSDHTNYQLHIDLAKHGIPIYWFPLGESYGMPLDNIYGALSVLWFAEKNNLKVLIHCMAGRNRSIIILDCYYYLRTEKQRADNSEDVEYGKNKLNKLVLNINDNQLPGVFRTEHFLTKCRDLFQNPDIAENAYIDWLKKETFGY